MSEEEIPNELSDDNNSDWIDVASETVSDDLINDEDRDLRRAI